MHRSRAHCVERYVVTSRKPENKRKSGPFAHLAKVDPSERSETGLSPALFAIFPHGSGLLHQLRGLERALLVFSAVLMVLTSTAGCGPQAELRTAHGFQGETMGTVYMVKVVAELGSAQHDTLAQAIQAELDDVNAKMSTYQQDSELSRFNASTETAPFQVSEETIAVFEKAHGISELSGGAFDVTVGPLVNAWGFGPDAVPTKNPSEDALAALMERVGYAKVEIDRSALTLSKHRADVYCDLSAVAKGYAVDRVAELLAGRGYTDYMVEVGGEVRTLGRNDRGHPWRIAIERPDAKGRAIHRVVAMTDCALATSGDYRNYYEREGLRLSHTIDPRTGRPIRHGLASVSVIHQECAMADGWATAIMVLGPDKGYEMAAAQNLAAFFIIRNSDGSFSERMTPTFESYLADKE